jgi:stearoyl-CoA desaturase (delta-9 desaturase)
MGGVQFGLSLLTWGVWVRTVAVWHITWSVNSITHVWGYRNYQTDENSRNNWFVALISNGEGWHNNHHADQRSAAHGHRWWEFDVTYLTVLALEKMGLARDVVRPSAKLAAKS